MTSSFELEALAAVVHARAAYLHAKEERSENERGQLLILHLLGIAHNAMQGSRADVAAHILGLLSTRSGMRTLHAALFLYDAGATVKHAKRIPRKEAP